MATPERFFTWSLDGRLDLGFLPQFAGAHEQANWFSALHLFCGGFRLRIFGLAHHSHGGDACCYWLLNYLQHKLHGRLRGLADYAIFRMLFQRAHHGLAEARGAHFGIFRANCFCHLVDDPFVPSTLTVQHMCFRVLYFWGNHLLAIWFAAWVAD